MLPETGHVVAFEHAIDGPTFAAIPHVVELRVEVILAGLAHLESMAVATGHLVGLEHANAAPCPCDERRETERGEAAAHDEVIRITSGHRPRSVVADG